MSLVGPLLAAKRLVYGSRGEPYRVGPHKLRYVPGTRPVRLKYLNSDDLVARYDAYEIALLSSILREGDTVMDVGAHAGQYAILTAAFCGQTGTVVAFEPDPHARALLARNIALNPHVKPPRVEALAVSDRSGEAILFSLGGDSRSSLARTGVDFHHTEAVEQVSITTTTLDDYGLSPNWIKIDTEGAEIAILRGAPRMLASDTNFLVELHPYVWDDFGVTFEELQALVAAGGRRMRYLDEDHPMGEPRYGVVILEKVA